MVLMRSYSSGVRPCCLTSSGVIFWCVMSCTKIEWLGCREFQGIFRPYSTEGVRTRHLWATSRAFGRIGTKNSEFCMCDQVGLAWTGLDWLGFLTPKLDFSIADFGLPNADWKMSERAADGGDVRKRCSADDRGRP